MSLLLFSSLTLALKLQTSNWSEFKVISEDEIVSLGTDSEELVDEEQLGLTPWTNEIILDCVEETAGREEITTDELLEKSIE